MDIYEELCFKALDFNDKNDLNFRFGDAVITKSYGGNSKHLIHVTTLDSGAGSEPKVVLKAIRNSIELIKNRKLQSIAFPALGTGDMGNLTPEQSALVMLYAVNGAIGKLKKHIIFVLNNQSTFKTFLDVFTSRAYKAKKVKDLIEKMSGEKEQNVRKILSSYNESLMNR